MGAHALCLNGSESFLDGINFRDGGVVHGYEVFRGIPERQKACKIGD